MKPSSVLRPISAPTFCTALLALGSLFLSAPARAQEPASPVQLRQLDPENLRLRVANPDQQPSRVEVVHLNTGQQLFVERYTEAAYGHRFNFHNLPTGSYALKLKVGAARYRYTIAVATTAQGSAISISEPGQHSAAPLLMSSAR